MSQEELIIEEQIEERLRRLADKFMDYYRNKEYEKAKICYDTARTVFCVMGTSDEFREELWGNRNKSIPGLFMESVVSKVFLETTVKRTVKNVREMSWQEMEERHAQRNCMGIYAKK